jgi:hypothetical protein
MAPPSGQPRAIPSTQAPPARPVTKAQPQGFSVVLVLGDIQSVAASDDVPPAARKALLDMKDFLPFKSFKLLDAAWLLCCGVDPQPSLGVERTFAGMNPRGSVTQMLRGPDDQEYELKLGTTPAEGSQVFVRFSLTGSASLDSEPAAASERARLEELDELAKRKSFLEREIPGKRDVGVSVKELEVELQTIRARITDLNARAARARGVSRSASQQLASRAIIDTSFTMNVGETVVVGTSRMKGGSKALIALLTAVPPRTGRND